jgi:hypothetical protein
MRERRRILSSFAYGYELTVKDETAAIDRSIERLADGLERLDHRRIQNASDKLIKLLEGRVEQLRSVARPREFEDVVDDLIEADHELATVTEALRSAPLQEAHDHRFLLGAARNARSEAIGEIAEREDTVRDFYGRDKG